jgi:hypothetical protein
MADMLGPEQHTAFQGAARLRCLCAAGRVSQIQREQRGGFCASNEVAPRREHDAARSGGEGPTQLRSVCKSFYRCLNGLDGARPMPDAPARCTAQARARTSYIARRPLTETLCAAPRPPSAQPGRACQQAPAPAVSAALLEPARDERRVALAPRARGPLRRGSACRPAPPGSSDGAALAWMQRSDQAAWTNGGQWPGRRRCRSVLRSVCLGDARWWSHGSEWCRRVLGCCDGRRRCIVECAATAAMALVRDSSRCTAAGTGAGGCTEAVVAGRQRCGYPLWLFGCALSTRCRAQGQRGAAAHGAEGSPAAGLASVQPACAASELRASSRDPAPPHHAKVPTLRPSHAASVVSDAPWVGAKIAHLPAAEGPACPEHAAAPGRPARHGHGSPAAWSADSASDGASTQQRQQQSRREAHGGADIARCPGLSHGASSLAHTAPFGLHPQRAPKRPGDDGGPSF